MNEQAAFEQWLQDTSPSGDCEDVHKQWLHSHARAKFLEVEDACHMDRTAIAARYAKAGKAGLMLEFSALCLEAKTKPQLVDVIETLDAEFHAGAIGEDWVDWREVNHLIARRIFSYDFGDQVLNV